MRKRNRPESAEVQFFENVQKTDSCWLWTGRKLPSGYGMFGINKSPDRYAHRSAWIFANGPIPTGMNVLHDCPGGDNPSCVNPAHLFLGTQKDNVVDMLRKGRHHIKLSKDEVIRIRELSASGKGTVAIARQFGVARRTIWAIMTGRLWNHQFT